MTFDRQFSYFDAFTDNLATQNFKIAPSGQTMVGPRGVTKILPPNTDMLLHFPKNAL